MMESEAADTDCYALLAQLYHDQGRSSQARRVCERAAADRRLSEADREQFARRAALLKP
jgi:hypothetical protein